MATLKGLNPCLEIYSVDEAFLDVRSLPNHELLSHAQHIRQLVKQWTGIPVSIGIAPTKTLAKVANSLAKKHSSGCSVLTERRKIEEILKTIPTQDIWGIGRRWAQKLSRLGIHTAYDVAQADKGWMRKTFNVVLARTALELKGHSCLSLEEISPAKKSMLSSRSFGSPVLSFEILRQAVSFHASTLARRLREQRTKASLLCISIYTNRFNKQESTSSASELIALPFPVCLLKLQPLGLKKSLGRD